MFHHIQVPIDGMTCAACAARLEKNLNKLQLLIIFIMFYTNI